MLATRLRDPVRGAGGAVWAAPILTCVVLLHGCGAGEAELKELLQRGQVHLGRRHYPEALAAFDAVLALAPAHFDARRLKAEILYNTARPDEAARILVELRREDPKSAPVAFGLALVRKDQRRFAEALELFGTLPPAQRPRVALAEALTGAGRHDEAATQIGAHLAENPFDSKAYYLLSRIEQRRGRDRTSRLWGDLYRSQEPDRRDDSTARSLEFEGRPLKAMLLRARSLHRRGRSFEALQQLSRLVSTDPRSAEGYREIGGVLLDLGRTTEAVAAFDAALRIAPGDQETTGRRAAAQRATGQDSDASPLEVAQRLASGGHTERARAMALFAAQSAPRSRPALAFLRALCGRPEDAFLRLWTLRQELAVSPGDPALSEAVQAECDRIGLRL